MSGQPGDSDGSVEFIEEVVYEEVTDDEQEEEEEQQQQLGAASGGPICTACWHEFCLSAPSKEVGSSSLCFPKQQHAD